MLSEVPSEATHDRVVRSSQHGIRIAACDYWERRLPFTSAPFGLSERIVLVRLVHELIQIVATANKDTEEREANQ
jgi:hypothetical protein